MADNKKLTIYDIAAEAGVSISTVSRVLTNSSGVRKSNREKVQAVIDKYNFHPSAVARSLSETKRKVIGIIMPDIRNPYYADLYMACDQKANKQGYSLFLANTLSSIESEMSQIDLMEEHRVDAIILIGGRVDEYYSNTEFVEKVNLINTSTPILLIGKLDGTSCPQIKIDAVKSIDLIMDHLLNLGHKDIAIIGGYDQVASSFEKRQRFKQILIKNQIEIKDTFCKNNGGYDFITGYSNMNRLFDEGNIPTAVIAINDFCATGIYQSINEHGLSIPNDISVISYDNTFISDTMNPTLSSIDYNYEDFAQKIIDTTIALCKNEDNIPYVQLIEPTLVIKNSTANIKGER